MPQLPINLTGVKPATGFDYPPGKYILKTIDVEVKTDTTGDKQYLSVSNEIIMGPGTSTEYTGKKIRARYNLYDAGLGFLLNYLHAVGITDAMLAASGGQPHTEWMLEKQYVAEIVKRNNFINITNEKPIENGAVMPSAAQAFAPTAQFAPPAQGFAQAPQYAPQGYAQAPAQMPAQAPVQAQYVPQGFAPPPPPGFAPPPPPAGQAQPFPAPPPPPGTVTGQ